MHEFFLCDFDKASFLRQLPGLTSQLIFAKIEEFKKLGLFQKDAFKVVQEHFLKNLGEGPKRRYVSLK